MSLATIVQKYVFRKPVDTGRYTGRTGGKAGFHPAFLSSVLHGGSDLLASLQMNQETAKITWLSDGSTQQMALLL